MALLAACVHRGLKVLSATGAGARADPTRIRVADLRESTNDPLSRAVSNFLELSRTIHVACGMFKILASHTITDSIFLIK